MIETLSFLATMIAVPYLCWKAIKLDDANEKKSESESGTEL